MHGRSHGSQFEPELIYVNAETLIVSCCRNLNCINNGYHIIEIETLGCFLVKIHRLIDIQNSFELRQIDQAVYFSYVIVPMLMAMRNEPN